jgi:chaperonin GroES
MCVAPGLTLRRFRLQFLLALKSRDCQIFKLTRNIIRTMEFKPLSNHVFIEPAEEEKVTKSGIVLPDNAEKEKPMKGKVLAVGPGKMLENGSTKPMSVKIGDMVLFKKYGPDEIEMDGKKYLVGDEDDILAIIQ